MICSLIYLRPEFINPRLKQHLGQHTAWCVYVLSQGFTFIVSLVSKRCMHMSLQSQCRFWVPSDTCKFQLISRWFPSNDQDESPVLVTSLARLAKRVKNCISLYEIGCRVWLTCSIAMYTTNTLLVSSNQCAHFFFWKQTSTSIWCVVVVVVIIVVVVSLVNRNCHNTRYPNNATETLKITCN
jgi:hypothetical protein